MCCHLLDQSSTSCTSFSQGYLTSVCPRLSTSTILLTSLCFLPLFLADHYMQVLACKHDCVRELATRSGRISPIENFLPLHYDYLQFAYYRGKGCLSVPHNACRVLLLFMQVWVVSWGNPFQGITTWCSHYCDAVAWSERVSKERTLEICSSNIRLTEMQLNISVKVFKVISQVLKVHPLT